MENDEKMFWDLFCSTGEPRYYSMYKNAKNPTKSVRIYQAKVFAEKRAQ